MELKLTPKAYVTRPIPANLFTEVAGAEITALQHVNALTAVQQTQLKQFWGEDIAKDNTHFILVQVFIDGLKPDIKNEMIKKNYTSISEAYNKAKELERHAEQKVAATKVSEVKVDYLGSQSGRGSNRGKPNSQSRGAPGNSNSSSTRGSSNKTQRGTNHYQAGRGAQSQNQSSQSQGARGGNSYSRGPGFKRSSAGVKCNYCFKMNHYAKDCYDRIAKGHSIPIKDIAEGLYNEDYFQDANGQETNQEAVESVHETFHSKN